MYTQFIKHKNRFFCSVSELEKITFMAINGNINQINYIFYFLMHPIMKKFSIYKEIIVIESIIFRM